MPRDEWIPFNGFDHGDVCRVTGTQCHDVFILVLDYNFYFDCIQFDWMLIL